MIVNEHSVNQKICNINFIYWMKSAFENFLKILTSKYQDPLETATKKYGMLIINKQKTSKWKHCWKVV